MSEFNFNYSRLNEKYQIPLTKDLVETIRLHARILLVPFFREVAIQKTTSAKGHDYPVLTQLAEGILESVFNDGGLDYENQEEAATIAFEFACKLNSWQKACLGFYFCSDEDFLDKIDEDNENNDAVNDENATLEDLYVADGIKIQKEIFALIQNDKDLVNHLVNELIHLQDIFSTEDISNWDASSITSANENFEAYAGKGQVLIPLSLNEYEYWEERMGISENEQEDEEE
jgi:hypothetical protein